MKIELVDALPTLIAPYKNIVRNMINKKKITVKEWNTKYKDYRDQYGYSIIHYFEAFRLGMDTFVTTNRIMLEDKEDLQKRFGVMIKDPIEATRGESNGKSNN